MRHDHVEERERRGQLRVPCRRGRCRHDGRVDARRSPGPRWRSMPPCCPTVRSSRYGTAPPPAGALEPGQPGRLHQPSPAGGLLLQWSDAAEERQALPRGRACGGRQLRPQVGVPVRSGDQVSGSARRTCGTGAGTRRSRPCATGRSSPSRAATPRPRSTASPEVFTPGTEPVAGADRSGQGRTLLPDDVPGAGRQDLPRGTGAEHRVPHHVGLGDLDHRPDASLRLPGLRLRRHVRRREDPGGGRRQRRRPRPK